MVKTLAMMILLLGFALPAMAETAAPSSTVNSAAVASRASTGEAFVAAPIQTDVGAMRASRIIGMSVYNEQDEKIGSVDDIVIGADRILHAIIAVGGFLGFGEKMVEVPFQKLQFGSAKGTMNRTVLPGATRQSLDAMQSFRYSRQG